jgi:acyl-coenzyme A synthetase/AMP-(fatty) acid ligase
LTGTADDLWQLFAQAAGSGAATLGSVSHEQVCSKVRDVMGRLERTGVCPGESIGLIGSNDTQWVIGLLALAGLGARSVLLPSDAPPAEITRLLCLAGAGRILDARDGFTLTGSIATPSGDPGTLLLVTSGSTAAPKLVQRTQASILDEGLRYVRAGLVNSEDMVLLALPVSHAYALGWLAGAVAAGARALPVSPKAFNAIQRLVEERATVLVSVPSLARVLVRRKAFAEAQKPSLRLVMCGAGFVDAELDAHWTRVVGVGVSRNYGSSETGAVLWGPPGLPSGCVGRPMPGVGVELTTADGTPVSGPGQGQVTVVLEDGRRHAMGDLAHRDATGNFTILGRARSGVVRRGARWVSTLDIESVLRAAPGVADLAVAATGRPDSDDQGVVAHYVLAGHSADAGQVLTAFARANLATHKMPDTYRSWYRLHRSAVGKLQAAVTYHCAQALGTDDEDRALAAAFVDLGFLPALVLGATAADLAERSGMREAVISELLYVAHARGVLTITAPAAPLASSWTEPLEEGTAAAIARGIACTLRGQEGSPGLEPVLPAAAWTALEKALRLWADEAPPDGRTLQLAGRWADGGVTGQGYTTCVVTGGIHGPVGDLSRLAALVAEGGLLLVADTFVEAFEAPACVRWLASRALAWWTVKELQAGLESAGFAIREMLRISPAVTATADGTTQAPWVIKADRTRSAIVAAPSPYFES